MKLLVLEVCWKICYSNLYTKLNYSVERKLRPARARTKGLSGNTPTRLLLDLTTANMLCGIERGNFLETLCSNCWS